MNSVFIIDDDEPMLKTAIANIEAIHEEIRTELNGLADCDDSMTSNKLPGFESVVLKRAEFGRHWPQSQTPLKTELDLEVLQKFFSTPWFYRMWVVQEAVVACYNECVYGELEINLRMIIRVAVWLYYKTTFVPQSLTNHDGLRNAKHLWYLEEAFNPLNYPNSVKLNSLMDYTFQRETTDLRDKVYGLLGVTKYSRKENKIPDLIRPDYTKSVEQVAQDVTRFIIGESKNLQAFLYIDHGTDAGPVAEKCSWSKPLAPRQQGYVNPYYPTYKGIIPSLNTLSEHTTQACTEDPDLLRLTGIQIGLVMDVSNVINVISERPEDWTKYLDANLTKLGDWISTQNDQMRLNRFRWKLARTLVAGVALVQRIVTEQMIDAFDGILGLVLDGCGRPWQIRRSISSCTEDATINELGLLVWTWVQNRKFSFMDNGQIALGPGKLQQGDTVVALRGSRVPAILRRTEEVDVWQLLGLTFVDGIMDGEAADRVEKAMKSPTTYIVR